MTTLFELNSCDAATFTDRLRGIYEHSPWIPERAAARRPFANATALKLALQAVVGAATVETESETADEDTLLHPGACGSGPPHQR